MPLLLLSNSRDAQGRFLVHPRRQLAEVLEGVREVAFVPYAGVTIDHDEYAARAREAFAGVGVALRSVHRESDPAAAVREAEGIVVGGGNTFRLLQRLQQTGLLRAIAERVRAGARYVGWSAGSVVACPTIRTTNDMPIVAPAGFEALGFVPFHINAHYTDFHPPGFQGETRAQRLAEFLALNPAETVVGLREGSMLRVDAGDVELLGDAGAAIFRRGREPEPVEPGTRLTGLLATR